MTTVAMLGASGNIGRAVRARLAERPWELIEVPRSWIQLDPGAARVDVVVNCVGAGMDSMRPTSGGELLEANVVAAVFAARLALASGARLVHIGSTAQLVRSAQSSPYVRSKRMASDGLSMLAETDGLAGFELLPHLVYGDPDPGASGVVAAMIRSMSSGEAFGLRTPHVRRDLVHRDDVARAVIAAVGTPSESWEVLEIGTGTGHALSEVAEIIGSLVGNDDSWRAESTQGRNWNEDLVADIAPASRRLGFRSSIELTDGLAQLVEQTVGGALL